MPFLLPELGPPRDEWNVKVERGSRHGLLPLPEDLRCGLLEKFKLLIAYVLGVPELQHEMVVNRASDPEDDTRTEIKLDVIAPRLTSKRKRTGGSPLDDPELHDLMREYTPTLVEQFLAIQPRPNIPLTCNMYHSFFEMKAGSKYQEFHYDHIKAGKHYWTAFQNISVIEGQMSTAFFNDASPTLAYMYPKGHGCIFSGDCPHFGPTNSNKTESRFAIVTVFCEERTDPGRASTRTSNYSYGTLGDVVKKLENRKRGT